MLDLKIFPAGPRNPCWPCGTAKFRTALWSSPELVTVACWPGSTVVTYHLHRCSFTSCPLGDRDIQNGVMIIAAISHTGIISRLASSNLANLDRAGRPSFASFPCGIVKSSTASWSSPELVTVALSVGLPVVTVPILTAAPLATTPVSAFPKIQ
ncbi:MAG: hypothetical protein ACLSH6_00960 [Limosilactobacillus pontis]